MTKNKMKPTKDLREKIEQIVEGYGNKVDSQGMANGFDECVDQLETLFKGTLSQIQRREARGSV